MNPYPSFWFSFIQACALAQTPKSGMHLQWNEGFCMPHLSALTAAKTKNSLALVNPFSIGSHAWMPWNEEREEGETTRQGGRGGFNIQKICQALHWLVPEILMPIGLKYWLESLTLIGSKAWCWFAAQNRLKESSFCKLICYYWKLAANWLLFLIGIVETVVLYTLYLDPWKQTILQYFTTIISYDKEYPFWVNII